MVDNINVVKRNESGAKRPLNIEKIHEMIE